MVNRFFQRIKLLLLPKIRGHCILCGDQGQPDLDICSPCSLELPHLKYRCQRCALPLSSNSYALCGQCLSSPPPFIRTEAIWIYRAPIAQLISSFKYSRQYGYGHTLGLLSINEFASAYSKYPDLIVPTPLHWSRYLTRGFNQSERLADQISRGLGIPLCRALKRIRPTAAQQSLNAKQRQQNLRGAFTVIKDVRHKSIAVVDDVMTTGATAREISNSLLKAGAAEVHIWCLARTPD